MNKSTSILITGITGFVGSYIARHLLKMGYEKIHGTKLPNSSMELLGDTAKHIHWHEANVQDSFSLEDAMDGIEVVIHCAAMISFQKKEKIKLDKTNIQGTANLVNAALYKGVSKIIHISSVAALGRSQQGMPINENSKWEHIPELSNYSVSKFLSEQEIWRGQAEGLEVSVLYPSIVLGGGRWDSGSTQLLSYADTAPTFYSGGSSGFVDVRDVALAIQLTIEKWQNGGRFLLNGGQRSYKNLLSQICSEIGKTPPRRLFPLPLATALAFLDNIKSRLIGSKPFLTKETIHTAYQHYQYDASLSEETLGLKYRSLDETVREMTQLYLKTKEDGFGVMEV